MHILIGRRILNWSRFLLKVNLFSYILLQTHLHRGVESHLNNKLHLLFYTLDFLIFPACVVSTFKTLLRLQHAHTGWPRFMYSSVHWKRGSWAVWELCLQISSLHTFEEIAARCPHGQQWYWLYQYHIKQLTRCVWFLRFVINVILLISCCCNLCTLLLWF